MSYRMFMDNLEKLAQFRAVAEAGSLNKAAEQLRLSQPNLTKTIQQLESILGCSLALRGRHGVSLTPEGFALFDFIKGMESDCEAIYTGITQNTLGPIKVTISTYPPMASWMFPRLHARSEESSLMYGYLTSVRDQEQLDWLQQFRSTYAIIVPPLPLKPSFHSEPVFETGYSLYSRGTSRFPRKLRSSDLREDQLFFMKTSTVGEQGDLEEVVHRMGLRGTAVDTHEIARGFALAGTALAVLPEMTARDYVAEGALRQHTLVTGSGKASSLFAKHRLALVCLESQARRPQHENVRQEFRTLAALSS